MSDFPDIPDFLRKPKDYRPEPIKGKRLRWTSEMKFTTKRKDEDPATRQLRRELAKREEEKRKARFAALAELRRKKQRPR